MDFPGDSLWQELWVSLASLLRTYTAAHGLNGDRQATVELGENRIMVRHGADWLDLERQGATIFWKWGDGRNGFVDLTEDGKLRNSLGEEEMDLVAESWARELML